MKKTILVCDDDDGILDVVYLALTHSGCNVEIEKHSLNIYKRIAHVQPAVLLLDLWMPLLSGADIAKTLRSNEATKNMPIIIVSGDYNGAETARELDTDYLEKPFDFYELINKIKSYL